MSDYYEINNNPENEDTEIDTFEYEDMELKDLFDNPEKFELEESCDFSSKDSLEYPEEFIAYSTIDECQTHCDFYKTCLGNHGACIKKEINAVLETLNPRYQEILKLKYGKNQHSSWQISKKIGLAEATINSYSAKALKELLSHSQIYAKFYFEATLSACDNFYSNILKNTPIDTITEYETKMFGLDSYIVDKAYNSNKSISEIKKELSENIYNIEQLKSFEKYFTKLNIVTFNQLLRTSHYKLFDAFEENDASFFELLNKVYSMGYKFKSLGSIQNIKKQLAEEFKGIIIDTKLYECDLSELPLRLVLKLIENNVKTINDLICNIDSLTRKGILSIEENEILNTFLCDKGLACFMNERKIYLSPSFVNKFLDIFINLIVGNSKSISEFKNEIINTKYTPIEKLNIIKEKCQLIFRSTFNSDIEIESFNFSIRTYNFLKRANINTLGDILSKTETDIRNLKTFGAMGPLRMGRRADEIILLLSFLGLRLKQEDENEE